MHYILFVWIFNMSLLSGMDTPLNNFYKSFENNLILKMEINFFQNQFGNTFNSSGIFYVIEDGKYSYESSNVKMVVEDSLITTINNETRQLIYSSIEKNYLSILDILSGNMENIVFQDKSKTHINHFKLLPWGYEGAFQFDSISDQLKSLKLSIDDDQNLIINVKSIDFIDHINLLDINYNTFEIIDLRD